MRFSFIMLFCTFFRLYAQENISLDSKEVEFLYNYYKQDGEHSAVTGGEGSQKLNNIAPMIIFKTPLTRNGSLKIIAGIDSYTSASSGNIDKYSTGASRRSSSKQGKTPLSEKDTRKHIDATYTEKLKESNSSISFSGGYSSEFDVKSLNAGLGLSKSSRDNNQTFSLNLQAYLDRWLLIYPGEIRNAINRERYYYKTSYLGSEDFKYSKKHRKKYREEQPLSRKDFSTDIRYTYNMGLSYENVINRKTNFALLFDFTYQLGILNTPFHRVYFDDGIRKITRKNVRVEKLPDERKKYALGFRLNHFLSRNIITRLYYRFYKDDFGILSHTFSLEIPIKIGGGFSFSPFIRYYQQTKSDYFEPFAKHLLSDKYYTSDYDLAEFSSLHRGIGFKFSPLSGVFNWELGEKSYIKMNNLQLRYSIYSRTDGLSASSITLGTKFTFN